MEIPPSSSRQPPDGHEFPELLKALNKNTNYANDIYETDLPHFLNKPVTSETVLFKSYECKYINEPDIMLYNKSSSPNIIDISPTSQQQDDFLSKKNNINNNPKRRLSKLKDLVIPESLETDVIPQIHLPEIKSRPILQLDLDINSDNNMNDYNTTIKTDFVSSITLPSWTSNASIPKYSPAFKRKNLHVLTYNKIDLNDDGISSDVLEDNYNNYGIEMKKAVSDSASSLSNCFDSLSPDLLSLDSQHGNINRTYGDGDISDQSSYEWKYSSSSSPSYDEPLIIEDTDFKCITSKEIKVKPPLLMKRYLEDNAHYPSMDLSNIQSYGNCDDRIDGEFLQKCHINPKIEEIKDNNEVVLKEIQNDMILVNEPVILEVNLDYAKSASSPYSVGKYEKPLFDYRTMYDNKTTLKDNNTKNNFINLSNGFKELGNKPVNKCKPIKKWSTNKLANDEVRFYSINHKSIELNLKEVGDNLGITLAGGIDYENKDISIYRIRYGSIAYQDGRLKKGDKVVSINGQNTAGLTYSAANSLLKEQCLKYVIVIEESDDYISHLHPVRKVLPSSTMLCTEIIDSEIKQPTHHVSFFKDSAGFGFSLEGGKDSPKGDVPLIIKKIFAGGAAEKCQQLKVGDEILLINGKSFKNFSRIEAWTQMKKIPDGLVKIDIYRFSD